MGRRLVNILQVAQRTNALHKYCKVTWWRHGVSPCRSAYFASPWRSLTLNLRRRRREAALLFAGVKALSIVRWATGKRLTNRLLKLSLITLSPPLNSGILGLRMRPYVPTPKFFTISGDSGRVIYQILDMRKITVALISPSTEVSF